MLTSYSIKVTNEIFNSNSNIYVLILSTILLLFSLDWSIGFGLGSRSRLMGSEEVSAVFIATSNLRFWNVCLLQYGLCENANAWKNVILRILFQPINVG